MPTIAILGAGPGLGTAVAHRYGRASYRVTLVARSQENLDAHAAELRSRGVRAATVAGDLSDLDGFAELAERIRSTAGDPDVIYFAPTADGMTFTPAAELTVEAADANYRLLFQAMLTAVREFLPHMVEQKAGAILTAQGATALYPSAGMSGPGPAMAAQRNYLQSLEREVSEHGVFVGRMYVAGLIKHSKIDQTLAASGKAPKFGMVEPDALADKLFAMHQHGRNHEVVAPAWGRAAMPLMATKPVKALLSRF